jgi:hypothetical protein
MMKLEGSASESGSIPKWHGSATLEYSTENKIQKNPLQKDSGFALKNLNIFNPKLLGSRIRIFSHPGSRGKKNHRITDPYPQHWMEAGIPPLA